MNKVLPLVALIALSFVSCTTLANRRDLYYPSKPEGTYTEKLKRLRKFEGRKVETGRPSDRSGRQPRATGQNPKF